jgi:hypothetical protein
MNTLLRLPKEMADIILEYQGYHVFRYGKYMIQIAKDDTRYKTLLKKPPVKKNMYGFWEAKIYETIYDRNYTYRIYVDEHSGYLHWNLDVYYCDNHEFKYDDEEFYQHYACFYTRKSIHYVYGIHPKQNLPTKPTP